MSIAPRASSEVWILTVDFSRTKADQNELAPKLAILLIPIYELLLNTG